MKNDNSRIIWIDLLKGFLLVLITFSHFDYLPPILQFATKLTGIVFVPCFFFLSGLLFSRKAYPTFKDFLVSKSRTLLIPYLAMSFLFLLLDWNLYLKPEMTLVPSLESIFIGFSALKSSPLWFVFTLYSLILIYYWIDVLVQNLYLKMLVILGFSLAGYLCFATSTSLPFRLEVTFSALTFLGIGHIFKDKIINYGTKLANKGLSAWVALGLLLWIAYKLDEANLAGVLVKNTINNYIYFYSASFCGIFALVILLILISQITVFQNIKSIVFSFLIYVANNGLPILAFQYYIIIVITLSFKSILNLQMPMVQFFATMIIMAVVMYFLIIPFLYNKLYFIFGMPKQDWKLFR